jgi:hypothetical protein
MSWLCGIRTEHCLLERLQIFAAWDAVTNFLIMIALMEFYLAKPHPHVTSSLRVMILSLISGVFVANGVRAVFAFGIKDPAGWGAMILGLVVAMGIWWQMRMRGKD